MDPDSLTSKDFDRFYAEHGPDPWGFSDRWYEKRKRTLTLAALPRERFRRAFEPGCSIGVLTQMLAERCDELLATDVAGVALAQARARTSTCANVTVGRARLPHEWPAGPFDLIVLSEVGYYLGRNDLQVLAERTTASLSVDGVVVLCHWRHPVPDYPLGAQDVHDALRRQPGLAVVVEHVEEDFLLDVLMGSPASSVARATGLIS